MAETIWQFGEVGSNYHDLTCECDHHCRNCYENLLRPQWTSRARYCSDYCRSQAKRERALDRILKGA